MLSSPAVIGMVTVQAVSLPSYVTVPTSPLAGVMSVRGFSALTIVSVFDSLMLPT